jgi:hypothetical protein
LLLNKLTSHSLAILWVGKHVTVVKMPAAFAKAML